LPRPAVARVFGRRALTIRPFSRSIQLRLYTTKSLLRRGNLFVDSFEDVEHIEAIADDGTKPDCTSAAR